MEEFIQQTFGALAFQPWAVYGAVCGFMILSAFGLPLPEEVILVSAGFVGHMSLFPAEPHPEGVHVVNVHVLATVAFFAVMGSDYLIYFLGKKFGPSLFHTKWFGRMVSPERLEKVRGWMQKYGYWPVIVFRFTPGVRFPGHLMCGAMGLSLWKFLAVDALAAGISVPTQIYFVTFYGREILHYFKTAKIYLFSALAIGLMVFLFLKWRERRRLSA
ncbi:MAG: DedA family protein [Bdellovibrionales bacterium]|nr:DedA family protein [Bdellovibrionales bacterium]